jgi:hypothetical protein
MLPKRNVDRVQLATRFWGHKKQHGGEMKEGNNPAPLSDMWINILMKQPVEKLSIALHTILAHQEVRHSALGGVPPSRKNMFITGTLMDKFRQVH